MKFISFIEKLKKPKRFQRASSYLLFRLASHYEFLIAPWIAKYLWFLFFPFYLYCKKKKIYFVVNIVSTMGHIIVELDHFFRARELNKTDKNARYIWLKKNDSYAKTCMKLYREKFFLSVSNDWIYFLFLPLTMRFKDVTFDAGISRLKWQLPKTRKYKDFQNDTYLHQVSKKEGLLQTSRYFQYIQETPSFFPLKDLPEQKEILLPIFPEGIGKLALLQIKDIERNATAKIPDPSTYLKTLSYLKNSGYQLVFVGREKMPLIFKDYGVINYAESSFASFERDIYLFNLADLILLTGCGVSVLADALDKHYLYLNSWHLPIPPFSKKSIFVPTLLQSLSGKFLSFSEQNALYQNLADVGAEVFPKESYSARNVEEEEILAATKELIALKENPSFLSPLQEKLRTLDSRLPMYYAKSRCSEFFLQKHKALFSQGAS